MISLFSAHGGRVVCFDNWFPEETPRYVSPLSSHAVLSVCGDQMSTKLSAATEVFLTTVDQLSARMRMPRLQFSAMVGLIATLARAQIAASANMAECAKTWHALALASADLENARQRFVIRHVAREAEGFKEESCADAEAALDRMLDAWADFVTSVKVVEPKEAEALRASAASDVKTSSAMMFAKQAPQAIRDFLTTTRGVRNLSVFRSPDEGRNNMGRDVPPVSATARDVSSEEALFSTFFPLAKASAELSQLLYPSLFLTPIAPRHWMLPSPSYQMKSKAGIEALVVQLKDIEQRQGGATSFWTFIGELSKFKSGAHLDSAALDALVQGPERREKFAKLTAATESAYSKSRLIRRPWEIEPRASEGKRAPNDKTASGSGGSPAQVWSKDASVSDTKATSSAAEQSFSDAEEEDDKPSEINNISSDEAPSKSSADDDDDADDDSATVKPSSSSSHLLAAVRMLVAAEMLDDARDIDAFEKVIFVAKSDATRTVIYYTETALRAVLSICKRIVSNPKLKDAYAAAAVAWTKKCAGQFRRVLDKTLVRMSSQNELVTRSAERLKLDVSKLQRSSYSAKDDDVVAAASSGGLPASGDVKAPKEVTMGMTIGQALALHKGQPSTAALAKTKTAQSIRVDPLDLHLPRDIRRGEYAVLARALFPIQPSLGGPRTIKLSLLAEDELGQDVRLLVECVLSKTPRRFTYGSRAPGSAPPASEADGYLATPSSWKFDMPLDVVRTDPALLPSVLTTGKRSAVLLDTDTEMAAAVQLLHSRTTAVMNTNADHTLWSVGHVNMCYAVVEECIARCDLTVSQAAIGEVARDRLVATLNQYTPDHRSRLKRQLTTLATGLARVRDYCPFVPRRQLELAGFVAETVFLSLYSPQITSSKAFPQRHLSSTLEDVAEVRISPEGELDAARVLAAKSIAAIVFDNRVTDAVLSFLVSQPDAFAGLQGAGVSHLRDVIIAPWCRRLGLSLAFQTAASKEQYPPVDGDDFVFSAPVRLVVFERPAVPPRLDKLDATAMHALAISRLGTTFFDDYNATSAIVADSIDAMAVTARFHEELMSIRKRVHFSMPPETASLYDEYVRVVADNSLRAASNVVAHFATGGPDARVDRRSVFARSSAEFKRARGGTPLKLYGPFLVAWVDLVSDHFSAGLARQSMAAARGGLEGKFHKTELHRGVLDGAYRSFVTLCSAFINPNEAQETALAEWTKTARNIMSRVQFEPANKKAKVVAVDPHSVLAWRPIGTALERAFVIKGDAAAVRAFRRDATDKILREHSMLVHVRARSAVSGGDRKGAESVGPGWETETLRDAFPKRQTRRVLDVRQDPVQLAPPKILEAPKKQNS